MPVGGFPHRLTYWGPTTEEDDYGVADFAAPVLIWGRWEDRVEVFQDPKGEEQNSESIVFADRELVVDGYLAEGDFSGEEDPHSVGAKEIKQVAKTRNMRNSDQEVRAYL